MTMYAEQSITGINLIDLNRRQVLMIRDALSRSVQDCELESDEKRIIVILIRTLEKTLEEVKK